ncbi:helix-turn-helix domain-containing protein [Salinispora arenicola]|uniref:helix-turn-helix domain-containing protein n=1 Tax=Salinispora arenicola TaxID=168697 RepID=UPI0016B407A5|nr:helix-turn-helix domain-containing protein [Salinispora arenicola]NIL57972.1 helix-turn-helix transcriptional regulator [Salinispora arenicola]NIL63627.1 helix-turn-helix transcriptional regulator [Salinispora arenicola]
MTAGINYVDEPERVAVALSPLRRQLLVRLRVPASATQLATSLRIPRQRVNYHLRALEAVGLIELVEERQRRGCTERIMRAKPGAIVVNPTLMHPDEATPEPDGALADQHAAEHLVGVAAAAVRDVARMQVRADEHGKRLLTFTIEADVRFADPAAVHRFTEELAELIARNAATYDTEGGRPYRMVAAGYPAPTAEVPADQ